jgi:hypothetical protein
MSILELSTEDLQARKRSLDSTLMDHAMAGLPLPAEIEEEFIAVQNELARRGASAPPVEPDRTWTFWLGKTLGSYTIDYLVEEGFYWYLFHASPAANSFDPESGPAWIKIAKSTDCYRIDSGKVKFATRLFAIDGDIVREVLPAQNGFFQAESTRLKNMIAVLDSASGTDLDGEIAHSLPRILEEGSLSRESGKVIDGADFSSSSSSSSSSSLAYYRTDSAGGDTLRDLLVYGAGRDSAFAIVSMFSQIAATLDLLGGNPAFQYHGNLKPENIMLTASGVYFRELGDFGSMQCNGALEAEVRTTTPQYYPWLDVDDIGALGICLWEALTDYHPFDDTRAVDGDCILSAELRALVDLELSLANMFVLPLLNIKRPHQFGVRTTEKLENVLFKSIKIRIGEDGLLYEDGGYESMSAFNDDLLELLNEPEMIF